MIEQALSHNQQSQAGGFALRLSLALRQLRSQISFLPSKGTCVDGLPVSCLDCPEPGVPLVCCSLKSVQNLSHVWTENPNKSGLSVQWLGLSHLTVIRTHIFYDHLLSSVGANNKLQ